MVTSMKSDSDSRIVDIIGIRQFQIYLNKCLVGPPSKSCQTRIQYLKEAIPKGLHKKILIYNNEIVGQIEYSPSVVSYYPIMGENLIVMNCIWVLRRVKGHDFGKKLTASMIESENKASGFATIALENHWSPWFRKDQIEKLGFKVLDSMKVTHKAKHRTEVFSIHLMWMSHTKDARPPIWNKEKLLGGITFCTAHPLYHSQKFESQQILGRRQAQAPF